MSNQKRHLRAVNIPVRQLSPVSEGRRNILRKQLKEVSPPAVEHYESAMASYSIGRFAEGVELLVRALEIEPESFDFQYGLVDHYIKNGQLPEAGRLAEQMVATHPDNPVGRQMLNFINRTLGRE